LGPSFVSGPSAVVSSRLPALWLVGRYLFFFIPRFFVGFQPMSPTILRFGWFRALFWGGLLGFSPFVFSLVGLSRFWGLSLCFVLRGHMGFSLLWLGHYVVYMLLCRLRVVMSLRFITYSFCRYYAFSYLGLLYFILWGSRSVGITS